jgi:hypothetical protein
MKKSIFSATELITALTESKDQYYTDIGRINYIIENYIRHNKENASVWIQDTFSRTMDIHQEGNITADNIETYYNLRLLCLFLKGYT